MMQAVHCLALERGKYVLVDGVLHCVDDSRKESGRLHLCVLLVMWESLMSE